MRSRSLVALFTAWLIQTAFGAAQTPSKHDSADQLFRRAPMTSASRSIAIPLSTNLHAAFDADLLRTHTAWSGPGLNLLGPPYTGKKTPFICTIDGITLWTTPPSFPWSFGDKPPETDLRELPKGTRFRGVSTKGGNVVLMYDLFTPDGKGVRVHETFLRHGTNTSQTIVRRFEMVPCSETIWLLVHAELGNFAETKNRGTVVIQREGTTISSLVRGAGATWVPLEKEVDYEVEQITEEGTVKGNPRKSVKGDQSRAYLKIPPHRMPIAFEIATTTSDAKLLFTTPHLRAANLKYPASSEADPQVPPPKISQADSAAKRPLSGDSFYRIEHFPLPKEIDLLVTGMDWLPDGTLVVCTWPGEIYIIENAQGAPEAATYRRFARGLNEPMGLKIVDGQIYVAQKAELTRVIDTDKNGEADLFETVNADWGYSGHYDAFAFGPALDKQGNFFIAFAGNQGRWDVPYPGWAVKISRDGQNLEGVCHGLRAPNGIAAFGPERDIFVSDNQGHWIGACKLNHLQPGKFYGYPSSFPAKKDLAPTKFDPPAIWFPRKLSPSTTDMVEISDSRFGPFAGQMIVGDFQNAVLLRVMMERVNGEWQGAVWPFAKGFQSGVNRLSFGPDGKLYVGGCNRAWSSVSPQPYSFERVSFTGKTPFEVQEVHALAKGFELTFTEPLDPESAGTPDNYDVSQFTYKYHKVYGSEEIDHDGNENSSSSIAIKEVALSEDKRRVTLVLEGLRPGYVTAIRCLDAQNADGKSLRNDTLYYTLNQIPK